MDEFKRNRSKYWVVPIIVGELRSKLKLSSRLCLDKALGIRRVHLCTQQQQLTCYDNKVVATDRWLRHHLLIFACLRIDLNDGPTTRRLKISPPFFSCKSPFSILTWKFQDHLLVIRVVKCSKPLVLWLENAMDYYYYLTENSEEVVMIKRTVLSLLGAISLALFVHWIISRWRRKNEKK